MPEAVHAAYPLLSAGMHMMEPTRIAMSFKLLLFVLVATVSPYGEHHIIRRINGARAALGLPIRSSLLFHSPLYVFPNEEVPEDARSFFNHSPSR